MSCNLRWRMDLLNLLIARRGYKRYLEIGVQHKYCYDRVKCDHKEGVDPSYVCTHRRTSDQFFAELAADVTFDLIFVDGLHVADQAKRDICNAMTHLAPGGAVVVHDCNPPTESHQQVPRGRQKVWTGDTWKAFVQFRRENPSLRSYVVNIDFGCGVIEYSDVPITSKPFEDGDPLVWSGFEMSREVWLNLTSLHKFDTVHCPEPETEKTK